MKLGQKKSGIIISYISEGVKVLTNLLYTPIMLRLLGDSEYGLYQLVNSVVSYLGLLSFGFASAYMRFYSRSKAKNDECEIAKLNGMFLTIFNIIAVVCLLCGAVMVFNIETIFSTGLTSSEIEKAKVLMALMVFNLALTFPNSVFNNYITAHEKFIFQKILVLLQALLNPFFALPLLIMGYGSLGMVLVSTGLTIGVLISNIFFCFCKIKIKFLFKGFKFEIFIEIFAFTSFLFLNQIIDQINWNVDKFLLGRMLGTAAVTVYGIGALLNSLYIDMSKSISNVFIPQINRIIAEDNDERKLTMLFTKVGRMQFLVLALLITGIIFFGQSFIKMWTGTGYEEAYYVALFLMVPETVPLIQNLGIEIQQAKNMHRARSIVYFFMAIANIFISIYFIKVTGEVGAAIGTAISMLAANIFFMNWYYHKKIHLDMKYFWKNILSMCKGLVIPGVAGVFILLYLNTNDLFRFLLYMVMYSIIYAFSMWFLGINTEEKEQVKSILRKFNVRG